MMLALLLCSASRNFSTQVKNDSAPVMSMFAVAALARERSSVSALPPALRARAPGEGEENRGQGAVRFTSEEQQATNQS